MDDKKARYEKLHVDHYVIFDPNLVISEKKLQAFSLVRGRYKKRPKTKDYSTVQGLGLRLWEGEYEGQMETLLRWMDEDNSNLIATGSERANAETERANAEAAKVRVLAEKLRELGVDPESL